MTRACPDCPAFRARLLESLVDRDAGCAFRCLSVAARQPVPARWSAEYGLALVRRGIVIRQRVDARGRATAIDIAGPGSVVLLGAADAGGAAYAVDDAMLCLCPTRIVDLAVEAGRIEARDIVRGHAAALARLERITEARGRATTVSRVAGLVLAIADTLSPTRVDIVPSAVQQRDLAALLAMRHESVCRAVAALTRSGALVKTMRGLEVRDRELLDAA